ncbi:hypothetical protein ACIBCR_14965 [Micromonospora echinospora]|uniref:hypothetical protein n=1 Tax=Micromonospora echinospora TaxID=1877 RepID=UPI0037A8D82F
MTTTPTVAAIAWRCDTCATSTTTGVIHINLQRVTAVEQELTAWEKRPREDVSRAVELAEVFAAPMIARWEVACRKCGHDCSGCYSIELALCPSVFALVKWTAHLYDKSWFRATNWVSFIHRVAQENGDPAEAAGVW